MLVETPTLKRYKGSFALFNFRILDMARMAPAKELQGVLVKEVKFLYHLMCVTVYGDSREESVGKLSDWATNLGSDLKLEVFKDMYGGMLKDLGLTELEPPQYVFSFTTIWDAIHYMCLLGDEMVAERESYDPDSIRLSVKNLKWVFYNIFIILFCPMCARHFLTIDTFPYEVEKVEVALYREKMGEPLVLAQELTRSVATKNVLLTHHLLYQSMLFHNHVNGYRPIQQNNDTLNKFQRMDWGVYKTLLGIL
jgi:hypothetical protein